MRNHKIEFSRNSPLQNTLSEQLWWSSSLFQITSSIGMLSDFNLDNKIYVQIQ